uniref:Uncharacterized protein n=1 Tax=Arion vulgaris TaxID=1028688 RepID=A0A0B7AB22_9EUPU
MPVRRHEPIYVPTRASKYATHHDYGIEDSINRADYLSSAVLQDTYEAAQSSRGKDHALLRNLNAAIHSPSRSRDNTPVRAGRPTKRCQQLSQVETRPTSSTSRALVPYKNFQKIRSALPSTPAPTSLLSSRIDSYLRGSSASPYSTRDNLSFKTFLPTRSSSNDVLSHVTYRPFYTDPNSSNTFSSKLIHGYNPPTHASAYRSISPYIPTVRTNTNNNDYLEDEDDEYDPETTYKRKYKIIRSPAGGQIGSGVRRIGEPAVTYPRSASPDGDQTDDDYDDNSETYGTYSCPRPSGENSLKLSSYDGNYDGSYEADMAEMYDYVPYGPSRQGILELTEHEDNNIPSSYLTSSSLRSVSPLPAYLSVVPTHSKYLDETQRQPYQSNTLLQSLLSNAAARAKKVLEASSLPDYKNASLVLSVEGSAVTEDGKNRYGFKYYPPPIPLKGSHIGLDERILGITPKSDSSGDSFLSNYLNKLRGIRSDVRGNVDKSEYGRVRSIAPVSSPKYVHSTVHLPVHIGDRSHSVPVSSYRSRLDNGQSHRVDVFPLVVSETTLPSGKKLQLPYYKAGGEGSGSSNQLTVLEKINIKAAIIGSRLESSDGARAQRRPRSDYVANKLRDLKREDTERKYK